MIEKQNNPVLVISAHAADFVWRAGGTIANYKDSGSKVQILALSYGERGESASIWKDRKSISIEEVKEIRRLESAKAASILGAEIKFLDWHDQPLIIDKERILILAAEIKEFQPKIILTHHSSDSLNPDHPEASYAALKAIRCAMVPGVMPEKPFLKSVALFMYEPDQPEFTGFNPDTFINITKVMDKKREAMEALATQAFLIENYTMRASYRAYLARRISGNDDILFAEAFKRHTPFVGTFFT